MNESAPIYAALKKYADEDNVRLHMPGHIGGKGFIAKELRDVAAIDVTEIHGLDDLHLPVQAIKRASKLLADAYGAGESFFLVNGATSGIHALFMAVSQPGCSIMVPRNAHRSFFGGMVLAGVMPVYIPCRMEPELGVTLAINSEDIVASLQENPEVKAVFLVSPSYYGTISDISSISEVVKQSSAMMLIDEAHGGHFPFHSSYPLPSLQGGADAVVNGLHKNLPVLNQGACLHLSKEFTNARDKIFSACSLLTTTSPSYPILASIDLARQLMVEEGEILLGKALRLSREFKARIAQIKGLYCYEEEELKKFSGVAGVDPLKVVISVKGLSIDGFKVADILRYKYKIQLELQEDQLILAMMSLFHEREDWQRLYEALLNIALCYPGIPNSKINECPPGSKVILSPREAFFAAKVKIALGESRNLISGEMISAYPPGIPCLLPGELITDEVLDYIQYLKQTQARVQGPEDPDLDYISVIQS